MCRNERYAILQGNCTKIQKSYKIYQRKKQGLIIQVFPISSVTVSLISFLSIDIQAVSLVIYARFLYHYGITTLSLAI